MTETYGAYVGRYAPATRIPALDELETAWAALRDDASFRTELHHLLTTYAGRPTPLTRVERFAPDQRMYLKREDLMHTGAHKINNAVGQALIAQRLGKQRIIAETGAGQHGVASATACARVAHAAQPVTTARGRGNRRRVAAVTMPSVPSLPTKRSRRS